jgi:hypothetical protein
MLGGGDRTERGVVEKMKMFKRYYYLLETNAGRGSGRLLQSDR